ncbi:hypothetical protein AB6E88_10180 [Providencia hangzhouensis]
MSYFLQQHLDLTFGTVTVCEFSATFTMFKSFSVGSARSSSSTTISMKSLSVLPVTGTEVGMAIDTSMLFVVCGKNS